MEKYVNEKTIIKNGQYEAFKDFIYCQICFNLMIEPFVCLNCQNKFCKKCAEEWEKKHRKCPLNCENTSLKKVIEKENMISRVKFKCIKGCGAEISFDDINNHYKSNCIENKKNKANVSNDDVQNIEEINKKRKIKILTEKQAELKTKNGKKMERMTSKIN